ncbi:MAG: DUF1553 domain-containing protein [Fuerstiella sp.]|nr:DUF1553 domain-containing protein [Fuerstiella sp.]
MLNLSSLSATGADPDPIIQWTFEDGVPGQVHGAATSDSAGLEEPRYPGFLKQNRSLTLEAPSWLQIPDDTADGRFDFDNGDAVTFEAWVRVTSMNDNAYIIGKGRTGTSGPKTTNQNWAFRLRKNKGRACVNFLFHSRKTESGNGDWHRWTSKTGFSPGGRWHHVAVSYQFGDPKSIRGFIDGQEVKGNWDMGGETTEPPVVDDDDVWIGSTMGGNKGNSFHGSIDDLRIHRREVPNAELASRFKWVPPELKPPSIPSGRVVVQLFGSIDSISEIPLETDVPLTEWIQDELGFIRLPHKYDTWGIREDWGTTLLVRAWTELDLTAGDYRLLSRSRGMSRLTIDGKAVLTTAAQPNRGGAHHVVDELPEVPFPGMRPHWMSDSEQVVAFSSDGKRHSVMYEVIVGGPSYRAEFGETCVAVAPPNGMFHILSQVSEYPLTDDGWMAFMDHQSAQLDVLDRDTRQTANLIHSGYWEKRHAHARQSLLSTNEQSSIDSLIARRVQAHNRKVETKRQTSDTTFFQNHIQPIFDAHCIRCHGKKEQGGLLIIERQRLLSGGESGEPAVVPGNPADSHLLQLVSAAQDDYRMPPKGAGLTKDEVGKVRQWIEDGAGMPATQITPIALSSTIDDYTFLRRVFIDTVGVPPTLSEANEFRHDNSGRRREQVINRLLSDSRWADNWVGYWQDALAENPNLLKPMLNNTGPFRWWIHEALTDNKPFDRFATELMLMRGSTWDGGTAGFSLASQNDVPMAAKAHVIGSAFLGVNMKCARCHDAPYHAWKQADLFQMAAMLDRKVLKLPATSTVPAAFFEKQARQSLIVVSLKPGEQISAHFPFEQLAPPIDKELLTRPDDTREQLAAQVTASRRFAEVIANRLWKRFMGAGLVDAVDDWEGSPPSDPGLLAALADLLIASDYDVKEFSRTVFNSDAYQRTAVDPPTDSNRCFEGPYRRRMTAEQIVDSAFHAVGQQMNTEPLTMDIEGTLTASRFLNFGRPQRSWEFTSLANERDRPSLALPRAQAVADVLKAFGWRNSRPEPTVDREEQPNLIQPGVLANGTLGVWLTRLSDQSGLTHLMLQPQGVDELVDSLFLQLLTRPPTTEERQQFTVLLSPGFDDRIVPIEDIGTAPEQKRFRYVSWSNHLNSEANIIKMELQELVRQGPPPTRYLSAEWRERAEDAVWSLLNSPEMILVP